MNKKKLKIGVIGTGIIGLPIAKNLIKNKYEVYAFARDKKKHHKLISSDIKISKTLEELFSTIDILILAVSETKDVKEILVGRNGLKSFLNKPSVVIDMSTICPIETISMSKILSKTNTILIDAPVSGGAVSYTHLRAHET